MTDNLQRQNQPDQPGSLNSKEAEEVVRLVITRFDEFKQARHTREKRWHECLNAFLNVHNYEINDLRKWRSQIFIPLSYEAATNIFSNLKRALFPTDSSFFTVEGKNEMAEINASLIKSFLLDQLEEMNFINKFGAFLKQLVVMGNSAAAIYWKRVARTVKETIQVPVFNTEGLPAGVEEQEIDVERIVYDAPEFETINIFDIVFDPALNSWDEGLVIHRSYRTYEQIKNNPVYKNTAELKDSDVSRSDPDSIEAMSAFNIDRNSVKDENLVKLYSAYGDFRVGDKIYYDYIAVVANDKYLIRFEPNPYPEKPFIFCVYENAPNEIYGIGAIEPGLGIQNLVNTFSNQKADVLSLLINGMWAYVDDGIIDPEEIVAKPGALIAVKDPGNIKPLHPDTSVALSYNEIAQLKAEYQEVTGATKYFTGGTSVEFRKTATEVSALQSAGIIRFSEVIQNIEQNALKRAIKLIFLYNSVFNEIPRRISLNQGGYKSFIEAPKHIFMDDYDFRIVGANSSISRDIRVNKLIEFIQMVGSTPAIAQHINIMELIKHLYRELGFKDENKIFNVNLQLRSGT